MNTVQVVRSRAALAELRDEWNELAAAWRSPLLDFDWFESCAESLHDDSDLRVVTLRRAGALVGVAPLVLEHTTSGARLTLLGASKLFEPSGWLYASDEVVTDLLQPALALGRPMVLLRIAAHSALCRQVVGLTRGRAIAMVRDTAPSFAVATQGSWEAYYGGLSSRITSNLPRLRRKAEREIGRMDVVEHRPRPAEAQELLDTLISIEDSGWKGRRGSSLARRTDLQQFFRTYCQRAAERGRLRVATLSFGSNVAAVELSVEAYNRWWQLKIGYQDTIAQYYPGLHLTEASIRAAFARGCEAYEFLGGAETWEERWRPQVRPYQSLQVYPLTTGSVVSACRDFAGAVWRRAHTRV
jgi:CelD/BcsL family acetyltransferase involved in cellulose biosynthesis